jgi:HlyD family secretion protein
VITEGEPIMWVVPTDQPAEAVVRIDAGDIEQVHPGQQSMLRFSAYSRRAKPLVPGFVRTVSADALEEPTTHATYYEVRVAFPD